MSPKAKPSLDAELSRDQRITTATRALHEPPTRGPGRPPGKRSDKTFAACTIYVKRDTRKAVARALLDSGQEFSELAQELFDQWLAAKQARR